MTLKKPSIVAAGTLMVCCTVSLASRSLMASPAPAPFDPTGNWSLSVASGVDDYSMYTTATPGKLTVAYGSQLNVSTVSVTPDLQQMLPSSVDIVYNSVLGEMYVYFADNLDLAVPIDPTSLSGEGELGTLSVPVSPYNCTERVNVRGVAAFTGSAQLQLRISENISFASTGTTNNCTTYLNTVQAQLASHTAPLNWTQLYTSGAIKPTGLASLSYTIYGFHFSGLLNGPAFALTHPQAGPPVQLTANVVDPSSVNMISKFNSCSGHPYPDDTSPNSAKNYFWPNSTNFNTNDVIAMDAACPGTLAQTGDSGRGSVLYLFCDNSSTAVRYFHINLTGQNGGHYDAGDQIGYAYISGMPGSDSWQDTYNFDIAVIDGDYSNTENYFAKLAPSVWHAWSVRGLTHLSQTAVANPSACPNYNAGYNDPTNYFIFSPILTPAATGETGPAGKQARAR